MLKTFLLLIICCFAAVSAVTAHPLGNFSVNQFSRLEVESNRIKVHQVLDLAEIPTFQETQRIDTDKNGAASDAELNVYLEQITPNYRKNLALMIDSQSGDLRLIDKRIVVGTGEGNLPVLRVEWDFAADVTDQISRVSFVNKNYAERVGWREIVVNGAANINIYNSSAFADALSDELRSYPENLLNAPLNERQAEFSATTGAIPANAEILRNRDGKKSAPIQRDGFADLITTQELNFNVVLLAMLFAFGFGAAHALSPGHGKAVVGAYLVGSRGTWKHAIFLGLTVTVTHTLGVFALGVVTLFAANFILPERLLPILSFISGLLVLLIGVVLLKNRIFAALGYQTADHHHDADDLTTENNFVHSHGGGAAHSHAPPSKVTWKSLLALGISGGLLPCPSALVLMLSAISLDRAAFGLLLTTIFSLGLAATLTTIGLIFLTAGRFIENSSLAENRIVKMLPIFSAFVITCFGAIICYNSLVE